MNEDGEEDLGDPARGDRGGGIHITRGGFRLPAGSISVDLTTGEFDDSPIIPELRVDTFEHWTQIAREASEAAKEPRRHALDIPRDDGEAFTAALEEEYRASMVAITAAAIAIESFWKSVVEHASETYIEVKGKANKIVKTLNQAFEFTAEQAGQIDVGLTRLFKLRNEAVHPPASWAQPVLHPVFNVGMEPRFVAYRVETAINARLFATRLIWICLNHPKPEHEELARWCDEIGAEMPRPPDPPAWVLREP